MPPGCDAVVMVEDVIRQEDGTVRLYASAAPWQHIRQIGEDVCAGEMILGSRAVISPAAIGAMLAAGVLEAEVLRRPVVGIIPTGDEIVPPHRGPEARGHCGVQLLHLLRHAHPVGGGAQDLPHCAGQA